MAANNKVTVSAQPTTRRPTSAERRSAQIASQSSVQPRLKQEAADRRKKRAESPGAIKPRKSTITRRRTAR
jgi:hypothetical protein